MTTAAERRRSALSAIAGVVAGRFAGDVETELVDFKVEAGTVSGRGRGAITSQHEPAALAIAIEVACMANTPSGGILIIGVDDRTAGRAAIVGAHSDADWLRRRIWALTQPNLAVDVEEVLENGVRLLLVNVPDALEEVRVDGRLRARFDTSCVEPTGDRLREFLEARRGFDWSAQPSGLPLSAVEPRAMASARGHYAAEHGSAPGSDRELARRLGLLVTDEGDDPELNRAGALLLARFEPAIPQLQLLITDAEGSASRDGIPATSAPLLPVYDHTINLLLEAAFPAERKVLGTQRTALRAIPELVFREALTNAVMHRDYRLDRATIVASAIGSPSEVFKVRSPGGLPPGVSVDRLIATPSRPRNPALANVMRVLGLAEREGVGIDTMYRLMLQDGHAQPEITEQDGEVVVRLNGGRPDLAVREFFQTLSRRAQALGLEVRAAIAVHLLFERPVLRADALAQAAQATLGEALDTLRQLADAGVVEQLLDGSRAFRFTATSRTALRRRIRYRTRSLGEARADLANAYLDDHEDIGVMEVMALCNVKRVRASQILRELVERGVLSPTRTSRRGPNLRYARPG